MSFLRIAMTFASIRHLDLSEFKKLHTLVIASRFCVPIDGVSFDTGPSIFPNQRTVAGRSSPLGGTVNDGRHRSHYNCTVAASGRNQ